MLLACGCGGIIEMLLATGGLGVLLGLFPWLKKKEVCNGPDDTPQ